jgi:hypothetical protein
MCLDLSLSVNLAARLRGLTFREERPTLPPEKFNDLHDVLWRLYSQKQIKFLSSSAYSYTDKLLVLFEEFILICVGKHSLISLSYG